MTKKELINLAKCSNAVIVRTRNNEFYLVCYNNLLLGNDGYMPLNEYDNNLEYFNDKNSSWSIIEVYKVNIQFGLGAKQLLRLLSDYKYLCCNSDIVYSNELVELTLQEIANKFKVNVSQLRIKE